MSSRVKTGEKVLTGTLAGKLSSLGEQCCDVEGRWTSGQDLMEHRLQRRLGYCSCKNYTERDEKQIRIGSDNAADLRKKIQLLGLGKFIDS